MNFIKMLSGDTEIIKHIYTEGDYVFSDITLKSEGFEEQTDGSRFRHVFNKGGKGARVFTDAPCDGEYYVALQVEDTFGTYDEEYIPVKDELCQPFEEKVTELTVGGRSIGFFRFGRDDRKYYTFYTENPVKIKKGEEISFKLLSGEKAIFTAIILTKTKPCPKSNAILNIKTDNGHLRFTTRLASRVRIIAGEKSFEENQYFNNHKFEIPQNFWGIRMSVEATDEDGNILRGRLTCRENKMEFADNKAVKVLLHGKDRCGEVQNVMSVLPSSQGELYNSEGIAITDNDGNIYPTECKITSRWGDGSIRTAALNANLPLDGRDFYVQSNVTTPEISDIFTYELTSEGVCVKSGDKEYFFVNSSDSILPDREMFAVLYDENKLPYRAGGGNYTVTHSGVNRITVSRINHFMNNDRRHMKCMTNVTFYRSFKGYSLEFGFENDLMESEFTAIEGIYLEEGKSYKEKLDIIQTDENTIYENGKKKELRHNGKFIVGGEVVKIVDFWQNYPKSVNADKDGMKIGICPFITKPELFRDDDFDIELRLFFYTKTGRYEFHCGLEKNHTIVFGEDADKLCDIAFLHPDSSVTEKSCAFGHIKCDCPDFTDYDESMNRGMEKFINHRENYREYGMLNYGDSFGEREIHWTNEEYDFTCGTFIHFLRTGDERFYEMARSGAAHYAEVDFTHRNIHYEEEGYFFIHTVGHANNYYPFEKVPTSFAYIKSHIGHIFTQGLTEYYKATGIERYKNAVVACADSIAKYYTVKYDFLTEREPGWSMLTLLAAYELTLDEYYINACRLIVERVYEKQDKESGCLRYFMYKAPVEGEKVTEVCYGGKSFMHGIVGSALKYYYYITGDEKAKEICLGIARWLVNEMYDDEIQGFWYTEAFKQIGKKTNIPETNIEILDVILFAAYEDGKKEYLYTVKRAFEKTLSSPYRRECDVAKVFSMRLRFAPEIMYYYNKVRN